MTKGWCPPSIYLEPAAVILVKSTCSCFSDQKTAMRQDSWMRALSLYAGVDREGKEISHLVGPTVRGTKLFDGTVDTSTPRTDMSSGRGRKS